MSKKINILLILIVTLLFPVIVNAEEYREKAISGNELLINDTAGVFTNEQVDDLKNNMRPLFEKGNVMLLTRRSAGERSIDLVATEEYQKVFATKSGVIIVINIYNGADSTGRNDDWHNNITVQGFGNITISDVQRDSIFYNSIELLRKAEFLEGAKKAFDSVCEYNNIKKYEKEVINSSTIEGVIL